MDVIGALRPFIRLWQIFGLFPYTLHKSNDFYFLAESPSLLRYSKAIFWLLAFSDGGTIVVSDFSFVVEKEISTKLVLFLSTATIYASFVMIFRTVVRKRRILCSWLNRFNSLCISCPLELSPSRLDRFNSALFLCTTLYFAALTLTNYLTHEVATRRRMIVDVVFFTRLWVVHLFLKLFVVLANCVRFYYAAVRENLRRKNTAEFPRVWVSVLRKLRCEDLLLKSFVEVLHSFYVPVLLVHLLWFFVTLLCDITILGRAGMPTVMQVQWMVYICAETVLYISVCHFAEKEAQTTVASLQDHFINLDNPDLQWEFELFSLQLQHTPLKFNALGFFNLDYTRLYSMIGATTTYTIILLQFQNNPVPKSPGESVLNGSSLVGEVLSKRAA